MAGKIPDLHAEVRQGTGKGAARQARRDGLVPGVVYGGSADPLPINIPYNRLFKMLKAGGFLATLFNLKVEGHDDVRVVCRDVQRDVVKDLPTHVDFLRLHRDSRIDMNIHVEFINEEECVGLSKGGVLTIVRPEVELNVLAGDIPDHITVDLAGLDVGDTITISSVELPEGVTPVITDRDFVIANVQAPTVSVEAEEADEAAEEGEETTEEAAEE
ncbi:MAG: 50S ribosomal protein L25/general stress protein Ctc [Rhodobacterales bacterium]|nr:MAG: 50S ribosomal protein L25/general stress protein Ctc [Rhodobacterales bacterium]